MYLQVAAKIVDTKKGGARGTVVAAAQALSPVAFYFGKRLIGASAGTTAGKFQFNFSIAIATPWPTPTHIVASARLSPRFSIPCTAVTTRRAPLMPSG